MYLLVTRSTGIVILSIVSTIHDCMKFEPAQCAFCIFSSCLFSLVLFSSIYISLSLFPRAPAQGKNSRNGTQHKLNEQTS